MAKFAACYAGTEVELADGNAVILDVIRKVIVALCHGTNKDCNALVLVQARDVVTDTYDLCVETERDLAAVGRKVIGDWVLDHLDELLLRGCRSNLVSVEKLYHKTSESLECTRNAHGRAHPDEDILGGLDVDLKLTRLVDWRVEEGQKTLDFKVSSSSMLAADSTYLVGDVGASLADIATHLAHDTDVVVAVQQVVLVLPSSWATARTMRSFVCLEGSIAQDDNQSLSVLVVDWNGDMLLCDKLGELWRRHRLGSW
jgi:hypothetical protein